MAKEKQFNGRNKGKEIPSTNQFTALEGDSTDIKQRRIRQEGSKLQNNGLPVKGGELIVVDRGVDELHKTMTKEVERNHQGESNSKEAGEADSVGARDSKDTADVEDGRFIPPAYNAHEESRVGDIGFKPLRTVYTIRMRAFNKF
ncbi:hypothetical protein HAX54_038149 [Datura stramonium]|uniref:Uncharacterized protein n=1 Tax=Datura stramonium TaxID=4076 RepID=A0ABS8VJD1_DATST|nr:hypothetical protein [Datura stramonium]